MMWVLTSRFGLHYTLSNFASLAAMTLIRFGIADTVIWRTPTGAHFKASTVPVAESVRLLPPRLVADALPPRSRRLALAVVAVCAAATVLRLTDLTAVGLNSDEAVYSGQGAAMFRVGHAAEYFSLFRAHPLLLQSIVGAAFRVFGQSDFAARFVVAMVFGVGSVALTYALGRLVSGAGTALVAAATCALLPYHVIVSRQVLVDTAMGFFAVLSLVLVLRWMRTLSPATLIGAFAAAGLATISKEVAVLIVPVLYYAVWHDGGWRGWLRPPVRWATAVYVLIVLPFPLTRLISQSHNASSFFLWQFNRAPNHDPDWFGRVLLQYVTPAVLILVVIGVGRIDRATSARRPSAARVRRALPRLLHGVAHQALSVPLPPHAGPLRLRRDRHRDCSDDARPRRRQPGSVPLARRPGRGVDARLPHDGLVARGHDHREQGHPRRRRLRRRGPELRWHARIRRVGSLDAGERAVPDCRSVARQHPPLLRQPRQRRDERQRRSDEAQPGIRARAQPRSVVAASCKCSTSYGTRTPRIVRASTANGR